MRTAGIIAVRLLAQIGAAAPQVSPLERLHAKIPVDSIQNLTTATLAGKYSDPAKEFQGGLSGNDLYLFAEVTWDADAERKYTAVHRQSRSDEILLIGTGRALSNFEEESKDQPETELMVVCKERSRTISRKHTSTIKEKLMRESWRPEYFRAGP